MITDTGPYLKAAVICSDVIEGKDGVLSLIRIIDRLTITAAGPQPPDEMPAQDHELKIVLMFIAGRAKGSKRVALKVEHPDATVHDAWAGTILLEGEDRGANLIIGMVMKFSLEGLYWYDVFFEGERVTRMPFRVIYQRVGAARL